jgi:hypothetical protein
MVTPEFLAAVSAETGVPAGMLSGETAAEVWASAAAATRWKASTAPAAPVTAAVSPTTPLAPPPTPQQLAEADDWLDAWRAGRLTPAGVPCPPERQPRDRRGMPW